MFISAPQSFSVPQVTLAELLMVGDVGPGGKPHSLAGLVYSRIALGKPTRCYMRNVVVVDVPSSLFFLGWHLEGMRREDVRCVGRGAGGHNLCVQVQIHSRRDWDFKCG